MVEKRTAPINKTALTAHTARPILSPFFLKYVLALCSLACHGGGSLSLLFRSASVTWGCFACASGSMGLTYGSCWGGVSPSFPARGMELSVRVKWENLEFLRAIVLLYEPFGNAVV